MNIDDNEYKPINQEICKENLMVLNKIFKTNNIPFRLGYGTLLGAIRDKNFIPNDQDVDLIFSKEHRNQVKELNKIFEKEGFEIRRDRENFGCLSRKGNNVDLYFFSESDLIDKLLGRVTCKSGIFCVFIDTTYFYSEEEIEFLGEKFKVFGNPHNWLIETYGEDWQIPQKKKGRCKTIISGFLCGTYAWLKPRIDQRLLKKLQKIYRRRVK